MNIDSDLIEDVPVPEDGFQRAMGKGNRALRRRRAAAIAGSTMLVAVMFIGIITARSGTDQRLSTAGSLPPPAIVPPANAPLDDTPLLALPAPALAANPAIPAGWQTVAYGFGQIAVPGDWQPLLNATCGITVPVVFLGDATFASGGCAVPSAFVGLTSITKECNDSKTLELGCSAGREVNGLTVQQINPGKCVCGTVSYYVADLQFRIDFTTVDSATADQILNTLTLSPQARVLAAGPLADASTWGPVVEQGVGLRVPSNWSTRRLTETDPGTGGCGGNPFTGFPRTLRLGQGGGSTAACPPVLKPWPRLWVDGAWVVAHAPYATEPADREVITIAGKRFIVVSPAGSDFVILEIGRATIAVGIGSDLSIARAIFRTITVDGLFLSQSTPLPSAKPSTGPDVPTTTVRSEGTTPPARLPAIVERPTAADAVVLRNGQIRFDLPRADDQPQVTGAEVWDTMQPSGPRDPSVVRMILLRYTNLIQGVDLGNGSVVPFSVDRLVWVAAVVPNNAALSTLADLSPYSLDMVDATTGNPIGLMSASNDPTNDQPGTPGGR